MAGASCALLFVQHLSFFFIFLLCLLRIREQIALFDARRLLTTSAAVSVILRTDKDGSLMRAWRQQRFTDLHG